MTSKYYLRILCNDINQTDDTIKYINDNIFNLDLSCWKNLCKNLNLKLLKIVENNLNKLDNSCWCELVINPNALYIIHNNLKYLNNLDNTVWTKLYLYNYSLSNEISVNNELTQLLLNNLNRLENYALFDMYNKMKLQVILDEIIMRNNINLNIDYWQFLCSNTDNEDITSHLFKIIENNKISLTHLEKLCSRITPKVNKRVINYLITNICKLNDICWKYLLNIKEIEEFIENNISNFTSDTICSIYISSVLLKDEIKKKKIYELLINNTINIEIHNIIMICDFVFYYNNIDIDSIIRFIKLKAIDKIDDKILSQLIPYKMTDDLYDIIIYNKSHISSDIIHKLLFYIEYGYNNRGILIRNDELLDLNNRLKLLDNIFDEVSDKLVEEMITYIESHSSHPIYTLIKNKLFN